MNKVVSLSDGDFSHHFTCFEDVASFSEVQVERLVVVVYLKGCYAHTSHIKDLQCLACSANDMNLRAIDVDGNRREFGFDTIVVPVLGSPYGHSKEGGRKDEKEVEFLHAFVVFAFIRWQM